MVAAKEITVVVRKHDGGEYRRWRARLARRKDPLLVLDAEFDTDVSHELLGEIRRGTRTVEYYWLDRWYNVFRFLEADGTTRMWYCNINQPPRLEGTVLSYIDLDIDILVRPDYSYEVMDLDEFEKHAAHFGYSEDEKQRVQCAVEELVHLIIQRQFPFEWSPMPLLAQV